VARASAPAMSPVPQRNSWLCSSTGGLGPGSTRDRHHRPNAQEHVTAARYHRAGSVAAMSARSWSTSSRCLRSLCWSPCSSSMMAIARSRSRPSRQPGWTMTIDQRSCSRRWGASRPRPPTIPEHMFAKVWVCPVGQKKRAVWFASAVAWNNGMIDDRYQHVDRRAADRRHTHRWARLANERCPALCAIGPPGTSTRCAMAATNGHKPSGTVRSPGRPWRRRLPQRAATPSLQIGRGAPLRPAETAGRPARHTV
jgi:hypothetical protein